MPCADPCLPWSSCAQNSSIALPVQTPCNNRPVQTLQLFCALHRFGGWTVRWCTWETKQVIESVSVGHVIPGKSSGTTTMCVLPLLFVSCWPTWYTTASQATYSVRVGYRPPDMRRPQTKLSIFLLPGNQKIGSGCAEVTVVWNTPFLK